MYNICVYFIVVVVVILGDKNDKKDVCSCPWPKLHHTAPQMVERSDADSGFACRICMQTNLRVMRPNVLCNCACKRLFDVLYCEIPCAQRNVVHYYNLLPTTTTTTTSETLAWPK